MKVAKFKSGYKYQLQDTYVTTVGIVGCSATASFLRLDADGRLVIAGGYAWDGATLCPDFDWIVRGTLIHDAIYQLIRTGLVDAKHKAAADNALHKACIEDGAWKWQAALVRFAVHRFGGFGVDPQQARPVRYAPPWRLYDN
ncbi:MAG: hypothetical protein EOM24_12470 [Chloroflexia bacterium]|nr:hypothetical protein [Chloroflexia bacterium]